MRMHQQEVRRRGLWGLEGSARRRVAAAVPAE